MQEDISGRHSHRIDGAHRTNTVEGLRMKVWEKESMCKAIEQQDVWSHRCRAAGDLLCLRGSVKTVEI